MEIFNLSTTSGLSKPIAKAYSPRDNKDKIYYRLVHGSIGNKLHAYTLPISNNVAKPTSIEDTLVLDGKDYELVINTNADGTYLKDNIGNIRYRLVRRPLQNMEDYRYILLVSLPIIEPGTTRTWICSSNGIVRANATQGYNRENGTYRGISPIIEVNTDNSISYLYISYVTYNPKLDTVALSTIIVNPFKQDSFTEPKVTNVVLCPTQYITAVSQHLAELNARFNCIDLDYSNKLLMCFHTLYEAKKGTTHG